MKAACPRDRAPVFAHGVPWTHAQPGLDARSWLQACNPKPRLLRGSHGRTLLVLPIFCGHQSIPLHLPSMFLWLSIPGSHCNYKNSVKTVSTKHRASWPMQFPTLFLKKKKKKRAVPSKPDRTRRHRRSQFESLLRRPAQPGCWLRMSAVLGRSEPLALLPDSASEVSAGLPELGPGYFSGSILETWVLACCGRRCAVPQADPQLGEWGKSRDRALVTQVCLKLLR